MNKTFEDCVDCPHYKGEGENGRPDCEIFNGSFAEFMKKCPQMNGELDPYDLGKDILSEGDA